MTEHNQLLLSYFDTKPKLGNDVSEDVQSTALRSRDEFYRLLSNTNDNCLPSNASNVEIMVRHERSNTSAATEYWRYLVVTGLRGGRAKKMACHQNTRHLKLVPVREA